MRIALVSGLIAVVVALIGQLPFFEHFVENIGLRPTTHVTTASYDVALSTDCDDEKDVGRVVLHSDIAGARIFFFPQGVGSDDAPPHWYVAKGDPA